LTTCRCRKLESTTVAGDLLTSATVTPAAVMAEACREHAWFGGFAGPLGELDDRIDQLLPVEQGGVVVVGARDLDDARLPGSCCRDRAALLGWHDRAREPYTTVVGTCTRASWSASG
jgi:hypothetical protein